MYINQTFLTEKDTTCRIKYLGIMLDSSFNWKLRLEQIVVLRPIHFTTLIHCVASMMSPGGVVDSMPG